MDRKGKRAGDMGPCEQIKVAFLYDCGEFSIRTGKIHTVFATRQGTVILSDARAGYIRVPPINYLEIE